MSGGRQRTLPQAWWAAGGEKKKKEEEEAEEDDDLLLAAAAAADPVPAAGFCAAAGSIWIYPTNYPVRGYQMRMARAALLANTLVCLPTGLGKTFVAAVVMYNFYRWFPSGKVLFLAPTKPLVAQQMEACARVMGIPARHMAEMTGRDGDRDWDRDRDRDGAAPGEHRARGGGISSEQPQIWRLLGLKARRNNVKSLSGRGKRKKKKSFF